MRKKCAARKFLVSEFESIKRRERELTMICVRGNFKREVKMCHTGILQAVFLKWPLKQNEMQSKGDD